MESYLLPRTGKAPLSFTGTLIGEVSSQDQAGHRVRRWHTIKLYRTDSGQYVAQVSYCTIWRGELPHEGAWLCSTPGEVVRLFEFYPTGRHTKVPREAKYDTLRMDVLDELQAGWQTMVGKLLAGLPEFAEEV